MITLYTRTVCPECVYIKGMMSAYSLEPNIINIDNDEEAKKFLEDSGVRGVPVLEHNGELSVKAIAIKSAVEKLVGKSIDF